MLKTTEYARKGHPDRFCDIASDALVDEFIKQDDQSRIAIDVVGGHNLVYVIGEVSSKGYVDIPKTVKEVYREIGYKDEIGVIVNIVEQSPEIRDLANTGAGDSGIMVGYATRETAERLPLEVVICKRVCDLLDAMPFLGPDGKVQVTIDGMELKTLVVSVQVKADADKESIEMGLANILKEDFPCNDLRLTIFEKGGFDADSGLTGRKNVLWYGPQVPTGGGSFAGKDSTKVDRSGAYYARKIAIDWLKSHPEDKDAFVKIAFAIGKAEPIMLTINNQLITSFLPEITVARIIKELDLRKPIYKKCSMVGHFGDKSLTWEQ